MSYFIDVILPLPLGKLFTYRVNEHEARFLQSGMRVAVSFGKSKLYSALVWTVHKIAPAYETKDIEYILDETPVVTTSQLQLWQWISDYYMCPIGDVYKAAMPSAMLLESETSIQIDRKDIDKETLTKEERLIYETLQYKSSLSVNEVSHIIERKNTLPILMRLVGKNAIRISEKIYEKYIPKLVKYVRLNPDFDTPDGLKSVFELLRRSEKQKQLLLAYFNIQTKDKSPIKAETLLENTQLSSAILKALIDKNILEEYYIRHDRVQLGGNSDEAKELTEAQTKTYDEIIQLWQSKETVLLHGVTASGKTEIYIRLIEEMLEQGKQVLYMLPEIGLSTQLIERLKQHFGSFMSVYHSKYTTHERVEVWNNMLKDNDKAKLIIGVRSSVFLPFKNLGLVLVDEEHDASYRQFDPSPRYQARDTALVLAKLHHAKVLLGSATPAIESLYNVQQHKYGYAKLSQRYDTYEIPDIQVIDLKDKTKRKKVNGHFSDDLITAIQTTLSEGRQIIIFQNRRGFAPVVQCKNCGTVPQCPHCDVSLTYHQGRNQLRCHYCGYYIAMPHNCIACGSTELNTKGFGTEQIAEELTVLFPDARIDRIDQDTTSGKYGHQKIISKFEQHETDILVGTQMITKGFDFENVGLVGVMNADALIHFPDFRAHERSFQILVQIAGRAGRSKRKGSVFIQTYNPQHPIIKQVQETDYRSMYTTQLTERQEFHYPPFVKLIKITFKNSDFNKINEAADWFAKTLRSGFAQHQNLEILGPEFPHVSRIRNEYLKDILLKIPTEMRLQDVKNYLLRTEKSFHSVAHFRPVRVVYVVD
ncbi:MAG: primosomal protein N' [Capnocytophaga sp.]|nr:primosomal protein N' [Capnocytophaga sp.]